MTIMQIWNVPFRFGPALFDFYFIFFMLFSFKIIIMIIVVGHIALWVLTILCLFMSPMWQWLFVEYIEECEIVKSFFNGISTKN